MSDGRTDNSTHVAADSSPDTSADVAADSSANTSAHAAADTGRAGLVLAAGPSRGFPTIDKALAPLDDTPLLAHATATLSPAVDELIVTCRADQRDAFAKVVDDDCRLVSHIADDHKLRAELHTALGATDATYAAVLPVGMPFLPTGFIDFLFAQSRTETGAVPSVEGQHQSVPAVVHVRAATAACVDAQQNGETTLAAVIEALGPVVVPDRTVAAYVEPGAFRTIETHEELAAAQSHRRQPNQKLP